jgi:anti-anti-sigma regulatory factor
MAAPPLPAEPPPPAATVSCEPGGVRLVLHEGAGLATAREVHAAALGALACGGDVVACCAGADHLDSAVLQILLALRRALAGRGRALRLEGASDRAVGLCRTAGLADLLGLNER